MSKVFWKAVGIGCAVGAAAGLTAIAIRGITAPITAGDYVAGLMERPKSDFPKDGTVLRHAGSLDGYITDEIKKEIADSFGDEYKKAAIIIAPMK